MKKSIINLAAPAVMSVPYAKIMGSSISNIADKIALHGSWEAYCAWRDQEDIPYFPDPEIVQRVQDPFLSFSNDGVSYGGVGKEYYIRLDEPKI